MRPRVPVLRLILAVAVAGCEAADPAGEIERRRPATGPDVAAAGADFGRLVPGDTVLGLVVNEIDVLPDPVDGMGWMGVVQYSGEVALSGEYGPHFDYPEVREICFFADDSSGARLPRFPNDVRRPWLCFSNQQDAARLLGEPGSRGRARIRIDGFNYQYQHSDVYNLARLVAADRLAADSANPSIPEEPRP